MIHSRTRIANRMVKLVSCAGLFLALPHLIAPWPAHAAERLSLEVRETSGLARGGYPAHALLKLPRPVPPSTKFRLLQDTTPVIAQFRPDRQGPTDHWWLDFQAQMAPFEVRKFSVEFGDDVPAGPERP